MDFGTIGGQELVAVNARETDVGKESEATQEMNGGDEDVPKLGMTFQIPEEAFRFYDRYAHRTGFGIKMLNSTYREDGRCRADGLLYMKQVILDHNHPLSPVIAKSYHTRKWKRFLENDDGAVMPLD